MPIDIAPIGPNKANAVPLRIDGGNAQRNATDHALGGIVTGEADDIARTEARCLAGFGTGQAFGLKAFELESSTGQLASFNKLVADEARQLITACARWFDNQGACTLGRGKGRVSAGQCGEAFMLRLGFDHLAATTFERGDGFACVTFD